MTATSRVESTTSRRGSGWRSRSSPTTPTPTISSPSSPAFPSMPAGANTATRPTPSTGASETTPAASASSSSTTHRRSAATAFRAYIDANSLELVRDDDGVLDENHLLTILSHELGHRWLAYCDYRRSPGRHQLRPARCRRRALELSARLRRVLYVRRRLDRQRRRQLHRDAKSRRDTATSTSISWGCWKPTRLLPSTSW